jgi:uncharacterized delta-60 repeat protein
MPFAKPITMAAIACAVWSALPTFVDAKPVHPGSLDRAFGTNGKAITHMGKDRVVVGGIVGAGGDGFYVAANTGTPPANIIGGRLLLLRYNSRGRLLRTFGARGVASYSLEQGAATVTALARQPDGRLIAVGSVQAPGEPGNRNVLLARFTSAGQLDSSFSGDGLATTELPGTGDTATDVVIQPDGRLVVVGSVTPDFTASQRSGEMVVLRYGGDGQLDPSFGSGGVVRRTVEDVGGFMRASSVALQSNGSILVGGTLGISQRGASQGMLARLHSNGSFDESVGPPDLAGLVVFGLGDSPADVSIDRRRGRIYVAGTSSSERDETRRFYLASLRTNLTLDPGFGTSGVTRTRFPRTSMDFATSVAVDGKGRVVLAGSAAKPPTGALALARFTTAGGLDKRFGYKGRVRVKIGGGWNVARALLVQPHGRLLVAGNNRSGLSVETAREITLARFNGG